MYTIRLVLDPSNNHACEMALPRASTPEMAQVLNQAKAQVVDIPCNKSSLNPNEYAARSLFYTIEKYANSGVHSHDVYNSTKQKRVTSRAYQGWCRGIRNISALLLSPACRLCGEQSSCTAIA